MRILVDRELCIGSENCNRYAPNTFETDATGKVAVRDVDPDPDDVVRRAVASCPVGALRLDES